MKKLISQGAEAKIFLNNNIIIKERFKKTYRIEEIDTSLRKFRTRREAKVIDKLNILGLDSPKLIDFDDNKMTIRMEYIKGKRLRDVLNEKNYKKLCSELGKKIALLHKNNIIHGDLTTSNFILSKNRIFFIDFGLSFFSHKIEDKAVDLHLLKQALESKHYEIWQKCFNQVLKTYSANYDESKKVLERLKQVEKRGRYKRRKK